MHADARNLLWDARQAAERVVRFTHGKSFGDYQTDELLRSAVERQLEIVGEALNQLTRVDYAREPKIRNFVIPAEAGVQTDLKALDSSWRREQIP